MARVCGTALAALLLLTAMALPAAAGPQSLRLREEDQESTAGPRRSQLGGGCTGYSHSRVVNVGSAGALQKALSGAKSGDLIVLSAGSYRASRGFTMNGKSGVTVCGPRGAVLSPTISSNDALVVSNCKNIKVVGITLRNAYKGEQRASAELRLSVWGSARTL